MIFFIYNVSDSIFFSEHIEKALTETDIQGVFNDLIQLFLTAIFKYQEADDDVFDFKEKTFEGNF